LSYDTNQKTGMGKCLKCHEREIEYQGVPCGCPALCKACAMKMATGGKCKVCGQMFGELRRVAHAEHEHKEGNEDASH